MGKRFNFFMRLAACIGIVNPGAAFAGACTPYLPPQPNSTLPPLNGQLVFQAVLNGQNHIFYYDFLQPAQGRIQLDANLNMTTALNPSFSSDGKWVVFTGATNGCGSSLTIYAFNIATNVLNTLI